jgi:hypothetical protein
MGSSIGNREQEQVDKVSNGKLEKGETEKKPWCSDIIR